MKYFIAENGNPAGPFDLNELLEHGLTVNSLLWNETMPQWTEASNIPEVMNFLNGAAQRTVPPIPPQRQWQYQQPQYAQQPYRQPMGPMPDAHMVGAILVTLFCCVPFGIVAIIKASQVSSCYSRGDYYGAVESSNDAKKWIIWGVVSNIILILLYLMLIFVFGVGSVLASSY
ncbi:MAG: CD225/dispanin family protein [Muribaculaceae bacterium]|nr:CD225/dispanin family protein [Muribaculaceae bacterium]